MSLEAHATEVGEHDDGQRRQADHGMGEGAEEESEGNEPERDARQRREQCGTWRRLADALGDERARHLDNPGTSVASNPACQAMRAGSATPARSARALAGSMMRKTCANNETVLMP